MDMLELIETKRFLGSEFLLWLWFKSECFDSLFETREHGGIEVWFDDKLTLEASLAETERNDFKGGAPAHSPEAKTALRQGKRPSKAKLGVLKEGREWAFTLKADSLDVSGVNIPALLSREEEEQFYERMYLVEELEDILRTLYTEFLTIRLSDKWEGIMIPAIRHWIALDEMAMPEHYPAQLAPEELGLGRPAAQDEQSEDDEQEAADEAEGDESPSVPVDLAAGAGADAPSAEAR